MNQNLERNKAIYGNSIGKRSAIYRTENDWFWKKKGVQYRLCLPGGLTEIGLRQCGWELVGYCTLLTLKQ